MTDSLPNDQKEALASQIPLGRLGTPNELAQAVLFLAGESGSYITSQTIHVNGGLYTVKKALCFTLSIAFYKINNKNQKNTSNKSKKNTHKY